MKKLSALLGAVLLAIGAPALAQDQPKPSDRPGEKVTPDRPLPKPTAGTPDSTMPTPSPAVGRDHERDHSRMGAESGEAKATSGNDKAGKVGVTYPGRTSEVNKHIAMVDLYLGQAMSNAKALSAIGDAEPGKQDTKLIQEAGKNLDESIGKSLTHLTHVRGFKSDLAMAAPGHDASSAPSVGASKGGGDKLAKIDELERHLKEAKTASKKLSSVKHDELAAKVDGVSTHLVAAQSAFKDIAKWTSYTLLEDSDLGTVPVSGQDETAPAGEIDRDLGTGTGTSSGSMGTGTSGSATGTGTSSGSMGTGTSGSATGTSTGSSPGATVPDSKSPSDTTTTPGSTDSNRDKGNTIPGSKNPEPTKAAPGGGY